MQLHRSDKARLELASRTRALNVRERGALFLADGRKTRDQVQALLQDDGSILQKLMADGYLLPAESADAGSTGVQDAPAQAMIETPVPPAPLGQGDNFEGKRSLATTRMFLFDICERMFVRKMPEVASHFRDQLREARDRDAMMAIARDIIARVEDIAGPERADGLSQRIAMLLPPEP